MSIAGANTHDSRLTSDILWRVPSDNTPAQFPGAQELRTPRCNDLLGGKMPLTGLKIPRSQWMLVKVLMPDADQDPGLEFHLDILNVRVCASSEGPDLPVTFNFLSYEQWIGTHLPMLSTFTTCTLQ